MLHPKDEALDAVFPQRAERRKNHDVGRMMNYLYDLIPHNQRVSPVRRFIAKATALESAPKQYSGARLAHPTARCRCCRRPLLQTVYDSDAIDDALAWADKKPRQSRRASVSVQALPGASLPRLVSGLSHTWSRSPCRDRRDLRFIAAG